jgi:hypothetical protein
MREGEIDPFRPRPHPYEFFPITMSEASRGDLTPPVQGLPISTSSINILTFLPLCMNISAKKGKGIGENEN